MKTMKIVPAVLLLALVAVMTSCTTTRDYSRGPYGPQSSVSLIISSPGLSIVRHSNGGYYYRDPRGYIYWRGYGNRYYLDRRYMNRSYHHHQQYNDWRRYHRRR